MSRHHQKLDKRRWRAARLQTLERDGWRCQRCGSYGNEADHIVPLHKGGAPYDMDNLQTLCGGRGCHSAKTAAENGRELTPAEAAWRDFVAELANINT